MPTSSVKYLGGLRTEATHLQSSTAILTDAPTDNHGKGEAFSPTDLVATSLATCILTTIGIVSMKEGFPKSTGRWLR
ncbi:MAG: OsmC family protein [Bacteroidia bacterium]